MVLFVALLAGVIFECNYIYPSCDLDTFYPTRETLQVKQFDITMKL